MTIRIKFATGTESARAICSNLLGGAVSSIRMFDHGGVISADVTIGASDYEAARRELRTNPMVVWFHR